MDSEQMLSESLAMLNNYIHTGQKERADELFAQINRCEPGHVVAAKLRIMDPRRPPPEIIREFGRHWRGDDLNGKSIEIFCDQGMGDTINMIRYLDEIKLRWKDSKIYLNCYAYYKQFFRLMRKVPSVDKFVDHHTPCDYHSNIFSIPSILSEIDLDVPYPAHFELLLNHGVIRQKPILPSHCRRPMRVGIAWKSNALNKELSAMKSMTLEDVESLYDPRWELISLLPETTGAKFLHEWPIHDLYDTAQIIRNVDAVVSVDTVVLHLAGAMAKRVLGLLCADADPRWGTKFFGGSSLSSWYDGLRTFRQANPGDWSEPLQGVRYELGRLYRTMDEIGFLNGSYSARMY